MGDQQGFPPSHSQDPVRHWVPGKRFPSWGPWGGALVSRGCRKEEFFLEVRSARPGRGQSLDKAGQQVPCCKCLNQLSFHPSLLSVICLGREGGSQDPPAVAEPQHLAQDWTRDSFTSSP